MTLGALTPNGKVSKMVEFNNARLQMIANGDVIAFDLSMIKLLAKELLKERLERKQENLVWVTNSPKEVTPSNVICYPSESPLDAVARMREWQKMFIQGPPKANETCTAEQLISMGIVGLYKEKKPYTIVVLNDGETWTSVQGCKIITYNDEGRNLLNEGTDPRHIPGEHVISEIKLEDVAR